MSPLPPFDPTIKNHLIHIFTYFWDFSLLLGLVLESPKVPKKSSSLFQSQCCQSFEIFDLSTFTNIPSPFLSLVSPAPPTNSKKPAATFSFIPGLSCSPTYPPLLPSVGKSHFLQLSREPGPGGGLASSGGHSDQDTLAGGGTQTTNCKTKSFLGIHQEIMKSRINTRNNIL